MEIQALLLLALLTFLTHWLAARRHFFTLPTPPKSSAPSLFPLVLLGFVLYLFFSLLLAPLMAALLQKTFPNTSPVTLICTLQLFIMGLNALSMIWLSLKFRAQILPLWKDPARAIDSPLGDFGMGILTWLISFPAVILISKLCDLLIAYLFQVTEYEQAAVRFLKMMLSQPSLIIMAAISILILAPIIEEFLFRALLQTWLKRKLGTRAAVLLASSCFAAFHLSLSQGAGNISLFISLFVLGCYLGFIYEKQGSLFASIGLHVTFNAISTLRILLD